MPVRTGTEGADEPCSSLDDRPRSRSREHFRYRGAGLADDGEAPVEPRRLAEAEQQDSLPLAELEPPGGERDLLRARAEQEQEQPLALARVERDDPRQQLLDVAEEARLALVDTD